MAAEATRQAFKDTMRGKFTAAGEEPTGRAVVKFLSQIHVDPDCRSRSSSCGRLGRSSLTAVVGGRFQRAGQARSLPLLLSAGDEDDGPRRLSGGRHHYPVAQRHSGHAEHSEGVPRTGGDPYRVAG